MLVFQVSKHILGLMSHPAGPCEAKRELQFKNQFSKICLVLDRKLPFLWAGQRLVIRGSTLMGFISGQDTFSFEKYFPMFSIYFPFSLKNKS